ncbi:hypothetical protein KAR91_81285 [Candidatus Pacearchaeota archaeon]|nr:hypothetical protein [Candidatus Pacearchaeota archaeon]
MENNPSGLNKNDTIEDALRRADELSSPNGSRYSGMMLHRKDLRRIVLLSREYRRLLERETDPAIGEWIKELEENAKSADYRTDGSLLITPGDCEEDKLDYIPPDQVIALHGCFKIEQLEDLIQHILKHSTDPNQRSTPGQDQ